MLRDIEERLYDHILDKQLMQKPHQKPDMFKKYEIQSTEGPTQSRRQENLEAPTQRHKLVNVMCNDD